MTRPPPLAATLRGYAASAPALWRPHLAAAADAVEEVARLRRDHMAHWCADDHTPIRHSDSEHEQCPLCRMRDERDEARLLFNKEYNEANESRRRLRAESEQLRAERDRLRQHLHDEHQRHVGTMDERDAALADLDAARVALENERMKVAACSTAAFGY